MHDFRAPRWLPGGHVQTIWPVFFSRRYRRRRGRAFRRERWPTPDGDFVDVDWLGERPRLAPLLVLFHGLEGSSTSHYAEAFAAEARRRGWRFAVPHFRGCSGELNLAPRAYHSGDHEEVGWMLARFRALHARADRRRRRLARRQCVAALRRGGRRERAERVRAVAAVSAPLDLAAGGQRDRPRLRPPGLHAHVPAHDEAEGAAQAGAASRACSTPSG